MESVSTKSASRQNFRMPVAIIHHNNAEFRMNSRGAYIVVNGVRIDLWYNHVNLLYVCATTAGSEAENANIQANICGSEDNSNLTRKGKLLLLWHQRLGHASFKLVRWLSRQGYLHGGMVDQSSDIICGSCRIARATKRTVENSESSQQVLAGKIEYKSIKSGDLKPGNRVSMDQYSSNTRG